MKPLDTPPPEDALTKRVTELALGAGYHLDGHYVGTRDGLLEALMPWWVRPRYTKKHEPIPLGPEGIRIRAAMPVVLDGLMLSGRLTLTEKGFVRYAHPADRASKPLPKAEMLPAFAEGMAARCVDDAGQRQALKALFLKLRGLHAIHVLSHGTLGFIGRTPPAAILVPKGYGIDPLTGPVISEARLIYRNDRGMVVGRLVPRPAMSVAFCEDGRATVTVDLGLCKAWDDRWAKVAGITVSPVPNRPPFHNARGRLEPRWKGIQEGRAGAVAYLGFEISGKAWNRFQASTRRGRKLETTVTRLVLGLLLPEVKRACLRSSSATVALANWFSAKGIKARARRLQASDSYPILTPFLHLATAEIDAGAPLAPALSERLGLHPRLVRHLVGRHWQSIGAGHRLLASTPLVAQQSSALAGAIPPERFPTKSREWQGYLVMAHFIGEHLRGGDVDRLAKEASADWGRMQALIDAGIIDSLETLGKSVKRVVPRVVVPDPDGFPGFEGQSGRAMVLAVVNGLLGSDGGFNRLERFNALFHRGVDRRTRAIREIEEAALARIGGVPPPPEPRWLPMTGTPFACDSGTITWITEAGALAAEGTEMAHCVSLRDHACRSGGSHVGKVAGIDGGRSTVEFRLAPRKTDNGETIYVTVMQEHKARRNAQPPGDCLATVAAFERTDAGSVDADLLLSEAAPYRGWAKATSGMVLEPADNLAILHAYADCLPRHLRGLSPEGWARLVTEADALRATVRKAPNLDDGRGKMIFGEPPSQY